MLTWAHIGDLHANLRSDAYAFDAWSDHGSPDTQPEPHKHGKKW